MSELPDPSTVQVSVDVGSLPAFLSSLVDQLKQSNDRISTLEATINDLTSQLTQSRQQSQEEVAHLQNQVTDTIAQQSTLTSRVSDLENLDPKNQNEKISDFQISLANLIDRVGTSEICASHAQTALTDMRAKIDHLGIRSQEISDQQKNLNHLSVAAQEQLQSHHQQLAEISRQVKALSETQIQLNEDTGNFQKNFKSEISEKIDRLQAKLSKELTALKPDAAGDENLGVRISGVRKISDQQLLNNMVSAAQKAIASAMGAQVARNFHLRVVDVWRQTAGEGAKRRIAVRLFNRSIARVIDRSVFSCWRDKVSVDRLRSQLETTLFQKIPSAEKVLGEFPAKMAAVTGRVAAVEANVKACEAKHADIQDTLQRTNAEVEKLNIAVGRIAGSMDDKYTPLIEAVESEVKKINNHIGELKKNVETDFASNKDLQKLMTDVLLLWNSMKQLDATKADRGELERLANEWSLKLVEVQRSLDDFVIDRSSNVASAAAPAAIADAIRAAGPHSTSQTENSADISKLQQQVTAIAQYQFDLVARLAAMRAIDASKLPVFPSSILPGAFAGLPPVPSSASPPPVLPSNTPLSDVSGQRPRTSFSSAASESQKTTDLLRYARSLVTAATNGNSNNRSPSNSRRELILPADLRLDGAPFRRN